MTTATGTRQEATSPRAASGQPVGMEARERLDAPARPCVGAFRRHCDNTTSAILCAACYAFIDRVMSVRQPGRPVRRVYRAKHGRKVAA